MGGKIIRRLKWGVAGCGNFAERAFIPTLQLLPKSRVNSLYSSDINRAKLLAEKFGVQGSYDSFEEFLKSDIDCVYISSANLHHYEQVIKAAKAGKHILCEKPLAVNSAQAEEMVRACEENNVKLGVNYVYRFHPLVIKAKEIIDKGMLGKIVSVTASFNTDYAPNENFRFKKALSGGGALRDIGTHMLDLLLYFGGEVSAITGVTDNIIYKSEVDDFAAAILKYEKSGYGFFNVSFNTKKAFNRVEILGYDGAISIEHLIGRSNHHPCKLTIDLNGEARKAFRKRGNKLLFALRAFQKSFLNNKPLLVSGRDGLINMKLMEELEGKNVSTQGID
ncbi:MAG: Gfo/Idh/MocA family oxidoreductase [Ignavibacteria bacterium]|nr:Gfo/Idh/MocA family oxidoreductase [Ignavibacteria bacterium]MCU7503669.1 Gfo/Idh/MocA family oxidoreductase [Ignavibacteria bacterium]MCU7518480.1 Gfo/Idh/MocA family oxidoreductase [Ignavibacteria bacterium]